MEDVHKTVAIRGKIVMNLNRTEPHYEEIFQIISKIEKLTLHSNLEHIGKEENYHEVETEFENLNFATHEVMKFEWDKAKKMFYSRWFEKLIKQ